MKAIDVHIHPGTFSIGDMVSKEVGEATWRHFRTDERVKSINEFVSDFKELDIKGILVAWDSETVSGAHGISNDYIAELSRAYPRSPSCCLGNGISLER